MRHLPENTGALTLLLLLTFHSLLNLFTFFFVADKDQIEHFCKQMNAGPAYPLLASMITQRSWDDIVSEDIDRYKSDIVRV